MKYFPLKTTFFCILFTPILYIVILSGLERYLGPVYQQKVENCLIGDPNALLDGTMEIHDAVGKNIHNFLNKDLFVNGFGLEVDIMVNVNGGTILFPMFEPMEEESSGDTGWDFVTIAHRNYEIMEKGLNVKLITRLRHGTLGANLVLLLLILFSCAVFFIYYKKGSAKALEDEREKGRRISELQADEKALKFTLNNLEKERGDLVENINLLRNTLEDDKKKATTIEDDLFKEILSLEDKLRENIELEQKKEREIDELKEKLEKNERRKGNVSKRKSFEFFQKRFSVLYKNLDMNRRALSGFMELNDDMQIKAEELIHQLNDNVATVIVKRKVFVGKKNKTPSFEVLFGYNGRLYFGKNEASRLEVLVVGNKNSQDRDMEFLHNI